MATGLFPSLLGSAFERLVPAIRAVHGGASCHLRGTATVTRGASLIANMLCAITFVPASVALAELEVTISADTGGETWVRHYGRSRPMRSRLVALGGILIERIGPAALLFQVDEIDGCMKWRLVRASAFGISLPRSWIDVTADIGTQNGRYSFIVNATLRRVGCVVRYHVELDVVPAA